MRAGEGMVDGHQPVLLPRAAPGPGGLPLRAEPTHIGAAATGGFRVPNATGALGTQARGEPALTSGAGVPGLGERRGSG